MNNKEKFLSYDMALIMKKWYTIKKYWQKEMLYMPEISLFYGIRVTMYYNDHMPPHFHAEYNGHKALVDINNIQVIKGSLPNK